MVTNHETRTEYSEKVSLVELSTDSQVNGQPKELEIV